MKRLLVLCSNEWLHPEAGAVENYVYEVFTRIASVGNYVSWICHDHRAWTLRHKPRSLEFVDGIQLARLGIRPFYRMMVRMLLARIAVRKDASMKYDAIIDCVTEYPIDLTGDTDIPIVPLVFSLDPKVRSMSGSCGPVIAVTGVARRQLNAVGVPDIAIIRAPHASGSVPMEAHPAGAPAIAVAGRSLRHMLGALNTIDRDAPAPTILSVCRLEPPASRYPILHSHRTTQYERMQVYLDAQFGYCGEGFEAEALAMGACGLPVIAPSTSNAKEFIHHEYNGLLVAPNDVASLALAIERLLHDEVLRQAPRAKCSPSRAGPLLGPHRQPRLVNNRESVALVPRAWSRARTVL